MKPNTNGDGEPKPETALKPPEAKPPKVKLYAECMGRFANLGGTRHKKRDIVELKSAVLEGEARANPAAWRIFTKEK